MVAYFRLRCAPIKFPQCAQPLRNVTPYSFKKERRDNFNFDGKNLTTTLY
jgi:hypothetical protein